MNRIATIPPNDAAWHALRLQVITSTESPALFGMSPYSTMFELWHRKRDGVHVTIDENERMEWGTELQDSIAAVLGRRYGVKTRRIPEYISLGDARMGASFDYEIHEQGAPAADNGILEAMLNEFGPGIFEIKAVDYGVFRDQWAIDDGTGQRTAPGHIEIQLQHQMHVRGVQWGAIGVLVGGNKGFVIMRRYDQAVGDAIEAKVRAFWQSIADDNPPPPIFPGDESFVCKLYGSAVAGKVADMRGDSEVNELVVAYQDAKDREELAKEDKQIARAKLLMKAGDAARAMVDGYNIDLGVTKAGHVSFDREAFRRFKMNPTGAKR